MHRVSTGGRPSIRDLCVSAPGLTPCSCFFSISCRASSFQTAPPTLSVCRLKSERRKTAGHVERAICSYFAWYKPSERPFRHERRKAGMACGLKPRHVPFCNELTAHSFVVDAHVWRSLEFGGPFRALHRRGRKTKTQCNIKNSTTHGNANTNTLMPKCIVAK